MGKYRPVSLASIPGKVKEQILLRTIPSHRKEKVVTGTARCIYQGQIMSNHLIFCDEMAICVDNGTAVNVLHLDLAGL